jgi:hypothetical protein
MMNQQKACNQIFQLVDLNRHVGWKHIKGELFLTNEWCTTNIVICNKLKPWWHPLTIFNISKKLKNLHDNILEFKAHFEFKIILIQQLCEED